MEVSFGKVNEIPSLGVPGPDVVPKDLTFDWFNSFFPLANLLHGRLVLVAGIFGRSRHRQSCRRSCRRETPSLNAGP